MYQIGLQSTYNWIQTILRSWSLTISSKSLSLEFSPTLKFKQIQISKDFHFVTGLCLLHAFQNHHIHTMFVVQSQKRAKTKNLFLISTLEKWKLGRVSKLRALFCYFLIARPIAPRALGDQDQTRPISQLIKLQTKTKTKEAWSRKNWRYCHFWNHLL